MKYITLAAFGAALLLGAGTVSAEIVDCKMPNENANSKAFFSANTNSGKGIGTETATTGTLLGKSFTLCTAGGPGDDGDLQLGNAFDPITKEVKIRGRTVFESSTASDPGNSPN